MKKNAVCFVGQDFIKIQEEVNHMFVCVGVYVCGRRVGECVHARVCVCVCERERERECVCLCVCV